MKKAVSLLLAVITVTVGMLFFCDIGAVEAKADTYGDLTYTVSNGEVTITYCITSATSVTIPETIDGYPVTSIGDYAFENCTSLTSISIPDSVTSIGDDAFENCESLTRVDIADIAAWCNIEFLGYSSNPLYYAHNLYLNGTLVTDLIIPDSVTNIGAYAFRSCTSLTSISIPDSVTSIGSYAFYNCTSLTSISIPDSVTSIGSYAFYNCTSLTSISIPDSVTSIGNYAFEYCTSLTRVDITDIAAWCNIEFSGSYSNPLYYAKNLYLNGTLVTNLVIPDSVTSIGKYAFYNCTSLENIYFNATNMTDLSSFNYVFYKAGQNGNGIKVTIGKDVTNIPAYLFCPYSGYSSYAPKITEVVFETGSVCESIGNSAFEDCTSLTSITIPDSVTSIGERAFYNCMGLTGIYFNAANMTDLSSDNYVFYKAGQNGNGIKVTIGKDVTKIPAVLFRPSWYDSSSYAPKITEVVFETDSVCESIGSSAFYGCTSLKSVTIPDSVTSIGYATFEGCWSLTRVDITDIAAWCNISFGNKYSNPIYFAQKFYLNGELVTNIAIPDSVTSIGNYAFYYCMSLTSVTIPDSVTSIGDYAFYGCTSLTSVTIGNGVTSIGNSTFEDCRSLTSITIPDSVTSIGSYAFRNCWSLTSITIPDSVTSIGSYAFGSCTSLETVYYFGTDEQWNAINIGSGNYALTSATRVSHQFGEWTVVTKPTCTASGEEERVCKLCSERETRAVPALGHDELTHEAKAPTCTGIGWDAYVTCSRCDHSTYNELPALGHAWSEWSVMVAHSCTSSGLERRTCSVCGTKENKVIAPAHSWGEWATDTEPTCTEAGTSIRECTACSSTETSVIPALGHDEITHDAQAPTCTGIGWDAYVTCSRCDYSTYNELPSLGHDDVQYAGQAPTCTEAGWNAYAICARCERSTYAELPALGHDEIQHDAQAATCTEIGWDAYVTCSKCDHSTYNELPALGHNDTQYEGQAPTCTVAGWADYAICSICDRSTYAEMPALGHSYDKWEMLVEPTENSDGFRSKVCGVCEDEQFELVLFASGDIDGDGTLTNSDMTLAIRALAGFDTANAMRLDTNYDGILNNRDIIAFIQKLAGWTE